MKHIKTKFNACYDLFKNGLSGFDWDATTSMWIAEPEVWDELVKEKPQDAEWRNKATLFYDKLAQLYEKDRATGEHVETTTEIKTRKSQSHRNNSNSTIEDIDNMITTNKVTLEEFEVEDETQPNTYFASHSQGENASRTNKRAKRVVEYVIPIGDITKCIKKLVDTLEMSTVEFLNQNKKVGTKDIWAQLEKIGVEKDFLPHIYWHLINNPNALKAFNGAPIDKHKQMLSIIVPDYSPTY